MEVFETTVTDKCASPTGEEPVRYESYVVVDFENDGYMTTDWDKLFQELHDEYGLADEDVHYYFTVDEWEKGLHDGVIETEEFTYWVGERKKRNA